MTTVWASAGRRYHRTTDCPTHERGQLLHDHDDWVPGVPEPKPWRELPEDVALLRGLTPCRGCLPGVRVWHSPSFGHEPMVVRQFGASHIPHAEFIVCERCYPANTSWPCATARVLRLDGPS